MQKWIKLSPEWEEANNDASSSKRSRKPQTKISSDKCGTISSKSDSKFDSKDWMKNFEPYTVDDLAVHTKKIEEVDHWLTKVIDNPSSKDMLLITGPVGSGKTSTVRVLADKHRIKISEWITPLDIELAPYYGDNQIRGKQSKLFTRFVLQASNYTSLLEPASSRKIILVEDFPNAFLSNPLEFADVLQECHQITGCPIVFICNDSNNNHLSNLFSSAVKESLAIQQISFNAISATGLKAGLKRIALIISKHHSALYRVPDADQIECIANSSVGDIRSAMLNLHFACLKGPNIKAANTSFTTESKPSKSKRKKKDPSVKFTSLGKDQSVSLFHGVGRVLNPKVSENEKLVHSPNDILEQFSTQPGAFLGFLQENYLTHFSQVDDVVRATKALSDADLLLSEWRDNAFHLYSLYVGIAGLMLSNKSPISAWNPVRGPKYTKIAYPNPRDLDLEQNYLYSGQTLVADYKTYCNIINPHKAKVLEDMIEFDED